MSHLLGRSFPQQFGSGGHAEWHDDVHKAAGFAGRMPRTRLHGSGGKHGGLEENRENRGQTEGKQRESRERTEREQRENREAPREQRDTEVVVEQRKGDEHGEQRDNERIERHRENRKTPR